MSFYIFLHIHGFSLFVCCSNAAFFFLCLAFIIFSFLCNKLTVYRPKVFLHNISHQLDVTVTKAFALRQSLRISQKDDYILLRKCPVSGNSTNYHLGMSLDIVQDASNSSTRAVTLYSVQHCTQCKPVLTKLQYIAYCLKNRSKEKKKKQGKRRKKQGKELDFLT